MLPFRPSHCHVCFSTHRVRFRAMLTSSKQRAKVYVSISFIPAYTSKSRRAVCGHRASVCDGKHCTGSPSVFVGSDRTPESDSETLLLAPSHSLTAHLSIAACNVWGHVWAPAVTFLCASLLSHCKCCTGAELSVASQ